jgi:hypothetical protein
MNTERDTIDCPGCGDTLRVRARVQSDGNVYEFFPCGRCRRAAVRDPRGDAWRLAESSSDSLGPAVDYLRALAVEEWRRRSTGRTPLAPRETSKEEVRSGSRKTTVVTKL